jgi:hypothetical protein
MVTTLGSVVFLKFLPEREGLPANDRVLAGRILGTPLEHLATNQILVNPMAFALQRSLTYKPKEPLEPLGSFEGWAAENCLQFSLDFMWRNVGVF